MKMWIIGRIIRITYHIRRLVESVHPLVHPTTAIVSEHRWGYLTSRVVLNGKGTSAAIHVSVRTWHPGFWWLAAGWLMDGNDDDGWPEIAVHRAMGGA